jgi:hypothetical protein
MTTNQEEKQLSNYEIQLALNEKCYKGHFNSIENLKRVLTETQLLHDQNDDERVIQKCIEIHKTAQKQLTELENKTQEVTRTYLIKKKELELFKINNIAKNLFKSFNLDLE